MNLLNTKFYMNSRAPRRRRRVNESRLALLLFCTLVLLVLAHHGLFLLRTRGRRTLFTTIAARHPHAYATWFATEDFTPALQVFLSTLAATHPRAPLVIGVAPGVDSERLVRVVQDAYGHLPFRVERWDLVPAPSGSHEHPRWTVNWSKLRLWQLEFERVLYVDADVMLLRNVESIFRHPLTNGFCGTNDWGRWTPRESSKMNGGVFLFRPSALTFAALRLSSSFINEHRSVEAEQGLLNYYYKHNTCRLPWTMNAQKSLSRAEPELWRSEPVSILHFTGEKPWRSWSTASFRARVDAALVHQLLQEDEWDAHEFAEFHAQWQAEYVRVRAPERHLRVYQAYSGPDDWPRLRNGTLYVHVWLSGPRLHADDLDAGDRSDPALGDLAAVIALAGAPGVLQELPWIGLLSASAAEEAGASLDWTRVDFSTSNIYYWDAAYLHPEFYSGIHRQLLQARAQGCRRLVVASKLAQRVCAACVAPAGARGYLSSERAASAGAWLLRRQQHLYHARGALFRVRSLCHGDAGEVRTRLPRTGVPVCCGRGGRRRVSRSASAGFVVAYLGGQERPECGVRGGPPCVAAAERVNMSGVDERG